MDGGLLLVRSHNYETISIAIMGDYRFGKPPTASLAGFDLLLQWVQSKNWLVNNYTLIGLCEVRNFKNPGKFLYKEIIAICNDERASTYPQICHHLVRTNIALTLRTKLSSDCAAELM